MQKQISAFGGLQFLHSAFCILHSPLRVPSVAKKNSPSCQKWEPTPFRPLSGSNPPIPMKASKYMNPDGTFKGGFSGCVSHMIEVEGHSKESATKICGYIAQHVKNRAPAPAEGSRPTPPEGRVPSPGGPTPTPGLKRSADGKVARPDDPWL